MSAHARLRLLVGTRKGLFRIEGDGTDWDVTGPFCAASPVNHAIADPVEGTIHAAGGDAWFGPMVWRFDGSEWSHSSEGLSYGPGAEPVKAVWALARAGEALYAGVEPAGLFRSDDDGLSWHHVRGLSEHPSRPEWQPGGGGLILHHILPHADDPRRLWVAVSTGGVFYSDDGGDTWEPRNRGTRMDYAPEDQRYPEHGQCVHSIAAAGKDRLYQQNHCGMYRSDDGGRTWQSIEAGLPSTFGFPAVAHPRDPDTLWLFPLNGDSAGRYAPDARPAVWRTRDGGASWQDLRQGLPDKDAYLSVLRQAMATDGAEPAGLYFGTTSGTVYGSPDEGESWHLVAEHLPTITSVETMRTAV